MTNEDYRQPSVDKSPSPIGAGLPLLQRLKMLKEKQVKGYNYYSLVHILCAHFLCQFVHSWRSLQTPLHTMSDMYLDQISINSSINYYYVFV